MPCTTRDSKLNTLCTTGAPLGVLTLSGGKGRTVHDRVRDVRDDSLAAAVLFVRRPPVSLQLQ